MCAPNENPIICVLIEQRDNALDEGAKAEGARRAIAAQQAAEREYWKQYVAGITQQLTGDVATGSNGELVNDYWKRYVDGLPNGEALGVHMKRVCDSRGAMNEPNPVAQLCVWWKGGAK